jgi:rrf2 family protein (putative transcriptional regulator)
MSHISTGVEYGLHSLLYLVRADAGVEEASVRDLAEFQGISVEFLAKLFTKLARAGLVTATEGVKGGYRLAKAGSRISVFDVIVAIDGDKPLFDCRQIRTRCAIFGENPPGWTTRGVCSIHAVMLSAEKAMREELKTHTLDELAQRVVDKSTGNYGKQVVHWLSDRSANRRVKTRAAE